MAACTRNNTGYTETLVDVLHPSHAGRAAVVLPSQSSDAKSAAAAQLTYEQLAHEVARARDGLSAGGLGPGDVVAMVLPNCVEFVVCWLATTNGRAIAAPLNPDYRVRAPPPHKSIDFVFLFIKFN
jgi:acyl-CoA synthetase (AMP-forming)/AMP-acid ligase II